jgi:hypothetical protein
MLGPGLYAGLEELEAANPALVTALRRKLAAEAEAAICAAYDTYVKHFSERVEWAEQIIARDKGIFSREAFRKIKASLHHSTFAHASEALQLFSAFERVLVKPDPPTFSGPPLPKTGAELMKMRRQRNGRASAR